MPNWVYSGIHISEPLTKKQLKIVTEIEKAGSICQYYKPRPEEYDFISGGNTIDGKNCKYWRRVDKDGVITDVPVDRLEIENITNKYGFPDWYTWSLHHWNTKWGDCRLSIDNREYNTQNDVSFNFESAWSTIGENIIEMFAKDFPDFNFWYEEETGWGGNVQYKNGEVYHTHSYDEPEWEDEIQVDIVTTKETFTTYIAYLKNDHPMYENGVGFYEEYSNDQYLGKTLDESKDVLVDANWIAEENVKIINVKTNQN